MTWRELFRRAWLVLRLRFKFFLPCCGECGVPMVRARCYYYPWGEVWYETQCPDHPNLAIRVKCEFAIGSAIEVVEG